MSCGTRLGALLLTAMSGAAFAGEEQVQLGAPVAAEALEAQRGGESRYEFNFQEVTATMEKTAAVGSNNGANSISGGAFGGASGFPVAVQNSGNNVIVQNAFIINLDVR
jgi:hypothetical protein